MQGTGDGGYVPGTGQILQIEPAERDDPVDLTGTGIDGAPIDLADFRGKVVVVNVWWSGCAPCRTEMPELVAAAAELGEDAQFLGINIRDNSATNAVLFAERYGATYPSVFDPTGEALLAFDGKLSPRAIPSTLVLDRDGRVAASILGELPSKLTLVELAEDVAGEAARG